MQKTTGGGTANEFNEIASLHSLFELYIIQLSAVAATLEAIKTRHPLHGDLDL